MEREILFRGKCIKTGKWIYGQLVNSHAPLHYKESYIIDSTPDFSYGDGGNRIRIGVFTQVNPKTVGQYVGLRDRYGVKIFEGDIVECEEWYIGGPPDSLVVLSVEFADGGYVVEQYPLSNWLFDSINGNDKLEGVTIIGNIHDNPELLDERKK